MADGLYGTDFVLWSQQQAAASRSLHLHGEAEAAEQARAHGGRYGLDDLLGAFSERTPSQGDT